MSTLKVYGWTGARGTIGQTREIILTTSWAKAAAASSETVGYIRKYGSQSDNSEEWDIARLNPGVVLYRPLDVSRKSLEGWQRSDGQPIIGAQFDTAKRDLLATAFSAVIELQELVSRSAGWPELYKAELALIDAGREMGIPRAEFTEAR